VASGFAAHFVKPVDLDDLKRCLDRLLVGPVDTTTQGVGPGGEG
jgi:hypothetical protein